MGFDKFLSVLFSKATLFLLSLVTLFSSIGITAANAQGTVECTENDCLSCFFCGCLTPETTCDIIDCVAIRCDEFAQSLSCEMFYCISECAEACGYAGIGGACGDCASVECLDTYCTDENGCITLNCNPENSVELSELTYGEIIRDYPKMISYAEFIDIAYYYYGREFHYKEYNDYCEEYNLYYN